MKFLEFLDFSGLEATGKSHDAKISVLENENTMLRTKLAELSRDMETIKPWMLNLDKKYNEMLARGEIDENQWKFKEIEVSDEQYNKLFKKKPKK